MRRRTFLLAASALSLPQYAAAQLQTPPPLHRVAWLTVSGKSAGAAFLDPFLEGMTALGYSQARNLVLDARFGEDSRAYLDRLALSAAALKPAVYVTQGPGLHAARKVHGTTPVVFGFSGDPVVLGVAASLARPGGLFTGVTLLSYELTAKRIELLHEVQPKARRLAILSNHDHAGDAKELAASRAAAAQLGLDATHYAASNPAELEVALAAIAAARSEAIVIHPDGLMVQQREVVARFSLAHRIPAISGWARIAEAGNLLTYGPNMSESYRRLAYFTDRILRGASPAELPVELPSRLELVLNLTTAKALGIAIPQAVLLRADRVIE